MADDILKSFLVSIGFKSDEASQKRFMEGLKKAELAVASLATGLTAMATAASVAALKVAGSFEALSYASQKAGATVQNLKGLSYAVSQLGGTYQGAMASIEAFAKQMRTNPGYEGLVRSLGVATRQNGKLRETTDILSDLGEVFRKKPYHIGYTYAQSLGIDEDTFRAIRDHGDELKRFKDEYDRTTRRIGLNNEEAGKKSTALMQSFRSLQATTEAVAQKLLTDFAPALTAIIDKLRDWIEQNPDQIRVWIESAGKAATALAAGFMKVVDAITPLVAGLGNITSSITGEKGLQGGLEVFATWLTTVWLVKILAAFTGVSAGWAAMLLRMGLNPAVLLGGAAALSGVAVASQLPKAVAQGRADPATGGALDENPMGDIAKENQGSLGRWWKRTMPTWLGGESPGQGMRARANRAATIGNWWTPDRQQHAIDRLKAGGISELGAKALVARWSSVEARGGPASVNPNSGAFGIAQWLGPRKPAINGNTSFDDQIDYAIKELKTTEARALKTLNAATTAREAAIGAAQFERAEGWNGHTDNFAGQTEAAMAKIGRDAVRAAQSGRPIGQATNVSDAEVIANDHGHYARLNRALGNMDFSARHGATDAPLGVTNNSNADNRSTHSTFNVTQHIQGNGSATDTAAATTRALTRFQEFSLRNAQGAVR